MRWILAIGVLFSAACSGDASVCAKLEERLVECAPSVTAIQRGAFGKECRMLSAQDQNDDSIRGRNKMLEDCVSSRTCEDFGGCFERHGCQVVLSNDAMTLVCQ